MIYLLINFQPLNLHAIVCHDAQLTATALRTSSDPLSQQGDVCLTGMAPALRFLLMKMQLAAFRQRAAARQFKTERHRAGFNAGKRTDLKPDARYATGSMLSRMGFNQFDCTLAKRYFVHVSTPGLTEAGNARTMPGGASQGWQR
jgi:hypothetical protein